MPRYSIKKRRRGYLRRNRTSVSRLARQRKVAGARARNVLRRGIRRRRRRRFSAMGPLVSFGSLTKPKITTSIRYVDTIVMEPGINQATFAIRGNSINDPQYSVGGHQPLFHDQWNTLYTQYRVLKCKYHFLIRPRRTLADMDEYTQAGTIGVYPEQPDSPGRALVIIENSLATTPKYAADEGDKVREVGRWDRLMTWREFDRTKGSLSVSGVHDVKKVLDDPQDFNDSTAFSTNPAHPTFIHLSIQALRYLSRVHDFEVTLTLDYVVQLSDPVEIAGS